MRRPRLLLIAIATLAIALGSAPATAASSARVSVTTLHFRVVVGPNDEQICDVIGDVYRPSTATRSNPAPAILTTNGFGGSKDDQAFIGQAAGLRGYVVLSYSGLGFGGSGCKIQLDDPDWDGKAASQLIGFLGGAKGIAFRDAGHTQAVPPVDYVMRDRVGHDGARHSNDPRVGMVGGSYGGGVQFAAASVDPRLDTIVPLVTWNDLTYSLTPNNTDSARGVSSMTPGIPKFEWTTAFFAAGMADGVSGFQSDPTRIRGCPNFDNQVCKSYVATAALGYPTPKTIQLLRRASVATYIDRIRIPTLLIQGEADTLFNLQEAIATYRALRARHVPVKMIWQSWGHSEAEAVPGEFSSDENVFATYEGGRVLAWFEHYLKGRDVSTGPALSYYRPWVAYGGSGPNDEQYADASSYPVGRPETLYVSGASSLVSSRSRVREGVARFTSAGATAAASYSETSAVQSSAPGGFPPPSDAHGTFVSFSTAPFDRSVEVVGVPTALLHLSAPTVETTQDVGTTGMLMLYAKIYDVAPDGSVDLVHRLVSPVRVPDVTEPLRVELPGIVHRFAAGHRLQLVIAASDAAYKNSYWPQPAAVLTSGSQPSTLTIPVVG
ncbi:MAG: CocE/NonD family hydrolase [Actinomycetota bacterium]